MASAPPSLKSSAGCAPADRKIERVGISERSARFSLKQRLILAVVPRLVWSLLITLGRTWRFEVIAEEGVTPAFHGFTPAGEIYCFWHQCVLPCAFYFRSTRATILISQSFDGELITRTLQLLGFRAVRGSSSRGGQQGMIGLRRVLAGNQPAIFTADGPRGPIYQSKLGPIKLAQITGVPIGAFHLEPQRAWVMRSWDRFLVPKPFTRIIVSWGRWTSVPAASSDSDLEPLRQKLDTALEDARQKAVTSLSPENGSKPS